MKKETADKLKRLIDEFCDAKIDYSWIVSYEPQDQVIIEDNVKLSLDRLNYFIKEITNDNQCQN